MKYMYIFLYFEKLKIFKNIRCTIEIYWKRFVQMTNVKFSESLQFAYVYLYFSIDALTSYLVHNDHSFCL